MQQCYGMHTLSLFVSGANISHTDLNFAAVDNIKVYLSLNCLKTYQQHSFCAYALFYIKMFVE